MTARRAWHVAGCDWPAIDSGIPLEELYRALEGITEQAVAVSAVTLDAKAARTVPEEGAVRAVLLLAGLFS